MRRLDQSLDSRRAMGYDTVEAEQASCCADASRGRPLPLGAQLLDGGANFSVFSRHAVAVELALFNPMDPSTPVRRLALDPLCHRTGDIWHVFIAGAGIGTAYAWRVDGPDAPQDGHRFAPTALLLDPYATTVVAIASGAGATGSSATPNRWRNLLAGSNFDWKDTCRPRRPWSDTIIYETHVRGLTIDGSSGVAHRGTYLGLVEKIPYLKDLGVTAIELMPVQEFSDQPIARVDPGTGERLRDYWGYSPIATFAPKESYASGGPPGRQIEEFRTMVRELHLHGLELILDVVFNHTGEGNENGPTISLRGLDNSIYYLLESDRRRYRDYTGTGNTLNCNHPVVRNLVLDCLRYWVGEMHVDGFRFDLASVLGRDDLGRLLPNPPLLEHIAEDPILRDVKLIAEAWDAGGAYQLGWFPGQRWSEWNGAFRDDVRRYWRGEAGMRGAFATRLAGSSDLYQREGKTPVNSINFVTCHDGLTLADLVSYAERHNEANGEANGDGPAQSFSANYGWEGSTADREIQMIRTRQVKNFLATLMVSRGVPMMLGGDELGRTQSGNSNAYCQDNGISWYDWTLLAEHADLHRFVRLMIAFRRRHAVLRAERFYSSRELQWFDVSGEPPNWSAPELALCAWLRAPRPGEASLCFLFNPGPADRQFRLPAAGGAAWQLAFDTAREPPGDIAQSGQALELHVGSTYAATSYSMIGFEARE